MTCSSLKIPKRGFRPELGVLVLKYLSVRKGF